MNSKDPKDIVSTSTACDKNTSKEGATIGVNEINKKYLGKIFQNNEI